MAASGYTPIQLYRTATASAAPVAGNLSNGELAINYNTADMALYAKNSAGTVKLLMNNPAGLKYPTADGTANQVLKTDGSGNLSFATAPGVSTITFGSTGLTPSTATSGAVTVAGTLAVTNGGTGGTTASTARSGIGAAASGANSDITSITGLTTALTVAQGGTGGTTAATARSGISAAASGANSDITSITGLTTALTVAQGGTGGTTASAARTSLGAAASGANSDITSIAGLTTALSVAQGGTGTATPSLVAGTNVTISGTWPNQTVTSTGGASGVSSFSAGTTGLTPSTATTGAVSLAGTLIAANGGTGFASYAIGDILYASTTTALSKLADVATGNALISGGVSTAPSWGKIGLTTHVSGTLGVGNGGTGIASYTVGDIVYASGSTTLSALADVATGNSLISGGVGVAPSWGKIGLTTHISGTLAVGNGGTGATTLTGLVKGNGTSAFTAATAGTDYAAPGTQTTYTATQNFNGSSSAMAMTVANILETTTVSATAATGTINYDLTTQSVLYYTSNASANWTVNFRGSSGTSLNLSMGIGQTITAVFLVTQGGTAYYNSAVTIDGSAVTPKWQGGSAPSSGNASSIDIYTYTIIKTASATYTVLASQTKFA